MKYSLILFFLISYISSSNAQIEFGNITYRETIKMELDGIPEAFKDQIPNQMSTEASLSFSPNASYYEEVPMESSSHKAGSEEEGMVLQIEMGAPGNTYKRYNDLKSKSYTEMNHFMGRDFLIIDDMEEGFGWKETGEEQTFNGIVIKEAIGNYRDEEVKAWYAPSIPLDIGPRQYCGLPGAILLLTRDNLTIEFIRLELLDEEPEMTPPAEGKKMSREKFELLQEKKIKEMEQANGGRGERIIIRG